MCQSFYLCAHYIQAEKCMCAAVLFCLCDFSREGDVTDKGIFIGADAIGVRSA